VAASPSSPARSRFSRSGSSARRPRFRAARVRARHHRQTVAMRQIAGAALPSTKTCCTNAPFDATIPLAALVLASFPVSQPTIVTGRRWPALNTTEEGLVDVLEHAFRRRRDNHTRSTLECNTRDAHIVEARTRPCDRALYRRGARLSGGSLATDVAVGSHAVSGRSSCRGRATETGRARASHRTPLCRSKTSTRCGRASRIARPCP